jgi:hypothetical protein
MEKTKPKIEFRPTEFRDQSGWYVQVVFQVAPPFQLGGFKTEEEAKDWVRHSSAQWLAGQGGDGYAEGT